MFKSKGLRAWCSRSAVVRLALAFVLLVIVSLSYAPGLRGPLVFDDSINITLNPAFALNRLDANSLWEAAVSGESGPLRRPIASVTLGLNYYFAGGVENTFPFKVTNLGIHLVNVLLVWWLATLILKKLCSGGGTRVRPIDPWMPFLAAAVWALHPLHLTSVLYVVQRMTSLATGFLLAGLIVFLYGRQMLERRPGSGLLLMSTGILGGLLLGVLSKENAIVITALALLLEFVFYTRDNLNQPTRTWLRVFYGITVLLPGVVLVAWLLWKPGWVLDAYQFREFTLGERLLTEARVLWHYLGLLVFPTPGRLTLFHDDIVVSRSLWEPWTTFPAILGLIAATTFAAMRSRRNSLLVFGVLWFLVGHVVESSFLALELVHEHRTYLPNIGLIIAGIFGIVPWLSRHAGRLEARAVPAAAAVALAVSTLVRADVWADESVLAETQLRYHPRSARSHVMAAEVHAPNDPLEALRHYKLAYDLAPTETAYLIRSALLAAVIDMGPTISDGHGLVSAPPVPNYLRIEPTHNRSRLALVPELEARIVDQLPVVPIMARTEYMLITAAECGINPGRGCSHMYPRVVTWLKASLLNPGTTDRAYQNLATTLLDVLIRRNDLDTALTIVQQAKQRDADNPSFIFMESNIYLLRAEPVLAEQTLARLLERRESLPRSLIEQADTLAAMINKKIDRERAVRAP